jgi:hypothetical protein
MKFVKANLDGEELRLTIEGLESLLENMKSWGQKAPLYSPMREVFLAQCEQRKARISGLVEYFQIGLLNTPNGQFIGDKI